MSSLTIRAAAVAASVLVALGGFGTATLSSSHSATIDDRSVFCSEFLPNERASWQPGKVLAKWANQNPVERDAWSAFADALCAGGSPDVPALATLHGRTLAAAGRMALPEEPPPTTTTTTTTTEPPPPPPPPPPPSTWPASYFTGPAGTGNIVPSRQGSFIGTAPDGSALGYDGVAAQYQQYEALFGRTLDIEHRFIQGTCTIHDPARPNLLSEIVARGHIPMISWFPNPGNGGQILRGDADACFRQVGAEIGALPFKMFLRFCWEFNGTPTSWFACGNDLDGSKLTATEQRDMFRRAVDQLRLGGAFPNASFVWSPHEGYFNNGDSFDDVASYPGDAYVDWVASDEYHSDPQWCGFTFGWCSLEQLLTHGGVAQGVEQVFRGRKPYMLAETGAAADGRTLEWFTEARDYIKATATGMQAFVYFDVNDGSAAYWRLDQSQAHMDGFKALATDPYFTTR